MSLCEGYVNKQVYIKETDKRTNLQTDRQEAGSQRGARGGRVRRGQTDSETGSGQRDKEI